MKKIIAWLKKIWTEKTCKCWEMGYNGCSACCEDKRLARKVGDKNE